MGILYTKDLINIKPKTKLSMSTKGKKTLIVSPKIKLDELLNMFIKSKPILLLLKENIKV